ncbi:transposable element Tcb1 transposase [Trichonephila clavipes]|nr:transposable element Tcb1 transposase [Trichonephila clavipes]
MHVLKECQVSACECFFRLGHLNFRENSRKSVFLNTRKPEKRDKKITGYLNCKIRPYIPNPLRCFKCQRFGHSQTACRGQLTCSRCASVGHASSDCTLEQKCVNCSQPHSADSKLCPKWKIEKEIQTIKTNRNISYIEARKFITPQPSQTYAQVAKSITVNSSSQTDETITKIVCPPLKLLQPLITISKPIMSPSVPAVIKSSTSTQAELVPSTSSVTVASPSKSQIPNSVIDTAPTTSNSLSISAASSSSTACSVLETTTTTSTVSTESLPVSIHYDSNNDHSNAAEAQQIVKRKSRNRRKRSKIPKPDIEIKRVPHSYRNATPTEITTDDEDMITYDVVEEELEQDPFILPEAYDGQIRVWRHRGERMLNSCVMHHHTGPAPGIMVNGDIGYHSRTPLVRIAGTLNGQRYISKVLQPVVLPYLQGLAAAIFQQDNA